MLSIERSNSRVFFAVFRSVKNENGLRADTFQFCFREGLVSTVPGPDVFLSPRPHLLAFPGWLCVMRNGAGLHVQITLHA